MKALLLVLITLVGCAMLAYGMVHSVGPAMVAGMLVAVVAGCGLIHMVVPDGKV